MRKRIFGRQLSRGRGSRHALFRSLIRALVLYGSINTTKAKAKAVQRDIDKVIGLAKKGGIAQRRRVYARLANDRKTTDILFNKIGPLFKKRTGGYTRMINLPKRRGDSAEIVRLEWTEEIGIKDKGKSDESKSKKKVKDSTRKSVSRKVTSKFARIKFGKKESKKDR